MNCYLCFSGSTHLVPGVFVSGDGCGTCTDCSVHACPMHGDRITSDFFCADCMAGQGMQTAIGPVPGPSDHAFGSHMTAFGKARGYQAESAPSSGERMSRALTEFGRRARSGELFGLADRGIDQLVRAERTPHALGIPEQQWQDWYSSAAARPERLKALARAIEALVTELVAPRVAREFDALPEQVDWATAAASIAYGVRGSSFASASPLDVWGWLRMSPIVIVVAFVHSEVD